MEDLISIIIPVYNVEKYLERCIKSVISQTYTNLEIILVDDGSIDNSGKICDKYREIDKRIIVIHKKNGGLSEARNFGIDKAKGNYIAFIDSDDYVSEKFILNLYNLIKNTNSDISVCNYMPFTEEKVLSFYPNGCKEKIDIYNNDKKFINLYKGDSVRTVVAWNKLYKKEIFDNLRYPVGKLHEDEFIIFDVLNRADKIVYTNRIYYYYLKRSNSIMSNFNVKRLDILEALEERLEKIYKIKNTKLYGLTLYTYYIQLIKNYNLLSQNSVYKEREALLKKLYTFKKAFFQNKYINPYRKLKILFKLIRITLEKKYE